MGPAKHFVELPQGAIVVDLVADVVAVLGVECAG
jgi:hypothetical protein